MQHTYQRIPLVFHMFSRIPKHVKTSAMNEEVKKKVHSTRPEPDPRCQRQSENVQTKDKLQIELYS